jgi:hypothetical protein
LGSDHRKITSLAAKGNAVRFSWVLLAVISKLAATFTVPSGQAFAPLTIRAKRSKASAKSCAKTEIYEAGLAIGGWRKDGSPQDYELEDI